VLERGAISSEQIRAEETRRTNPDLYRELRRQRYIQGGEEERPAVISVNALFGALAVNEFLARVHVFRDAGNKEFSTVRGDLCEFAPHREAKEESKGDNRISRPTATWASNHIGRSPRKISDSPPI
jgi:hypothetical protein